MIHRYIYGVLTAGMNLYKTDEKLLNDLFDDDLTLEVSELAAIKTYIQTKDVSIVNGYPRLATKPPVMAITLSREGETTEFIGDDGGIVLDDPELSGMDIETSVWEYGYRILIYTEHPDVTSYYYEIAKSAMLAGLKTLTDEGCFGYKMSGLDMAPDPRYIPDHLIARVLEFSCQREFQRVDRASRLQKAFAVSGIHIDSAGSPSDVGDVKTLVSPYTEGENG